MPLLDVFWTMLLVFGWVLWFVLLFRMYGDLFSRDDIGGWAKTGWVVFTLVLPFLGVFVYLISQGRGMADRAALRFERERAAADAHIRAVVADAEAQKTGKADDLLQSGAITREEYERMVPARG
jgi:Phospholipase_D-nuclease N-terminal